MISLPLFAENGSGVQAYKDYYKKPGSDKATAHIPENKDIAGLAATLTARCDNDYEKIWAIYKWICDNISYDTSYKIKTADEGYKKKKGVCQAYCEIFYLMAKAAGIRAELVSGISKGQTGYISRQGHAWIFAYTRPDHGILLDPTWGAGSVDGNEFIKREDCSVWFNVDPEWMIMSHYPDAKEYQLIGKPMTEQEFKAMTPIDYLWLTYGLDPHYLYEQNRNKALQLPRFFNHGEERVWLLDFPKSESLRVGHAYDFRIKVAQGVRFGFINDTPYCMTEEWQCESEDGQYSVSFTPRADDDVNLCLYDDSDNQWYTIVKYTIIPPTADDWQMLETVYPLYTPDAQATGNMDAAGWAAFGIDQHQLLSLIRTEGVKDLPTIFTTQGQKMRIVSVPMHRQLRAGVPVTLSFYPEAGIEWAVVENKSWHRNWQVSDDNLHTMTVTPQMPGTLALYVKMKEGKSYWQCIEYEVTN